MALLHPPPGPHPTRRTRLAAPLLWAAGLLAAVAMLHVRDPHQAGSYAFCPWLLLTGTYCPGCGGLRAVHDLTHVDLGAALSSNLLVVALVPVTVLLGVGWTRARWRGTPFRSALATKPVVWSLLAVVLAFGILRNQSLGGWLAP